jgi:hypothetical protein
LTDWSTLDTAELLQADRSTESAAGAHAIRMPPNTVTNRATCTPVLIPG